MIKDFENSGQNNEAKDNKKRAPPDSHEDDDFVGPNPAKLQKLELHELFLQNLPSSEVYQISYMHRDVVNNVISSNKTDFIITCSIDGHIKFWRKVFSLIEFARNFKAHNGLIMGLSLSKEHDLLCSVGTDKTLKIFDVMNCDLRSVIKLNFSPSSCEFIPQSEFDWHLIAISEEKTGKIMIVDPQNTWKNNQQVEKDQEIIENNQELGEDQKKEQKSSIINVLSFHKHPIKFIKMNWHLNICLSIDERGFLEIWDPFTFDFPKTLKYKCKIEADFLQLLPANSAPLSLSISPKGTYAAVMLKDKIVRLFNLKTGKLILALNQSIKEIMKIQQDANHQNHNELVLDQQEYQKKLNIEKDLQISKEFLYNPNFEFDESQQYLIYASFHGIKFYSIARRCIERIIGKKQTQRFIRVNVYQGRVMRNPSGNSNTKGERRGTDPIISTTSFKRSRFYIFSKRAPQVSAQNLYVRDMVNERPNKQELQLTNQVKTVEKQNEVVLQTTLGDIHLLLYLQDCPKTCQNFIKLVKKGYYNGTVFHRVIKGFMNQGGCPKGDGTGGESIWGGNFEDQISDKHIFDKPYCLAMANRGPNTNGSQFFITVVACPWLNAKHTVFGRVIKGIETVCEINKLKTDKGEKPLINVKIMSSKVI